MNQITYNVHPSVELMYTFPKLKPLIKNQNDLKRSLDFFQDLNSRLEMKNVPLSKEPVCCYKNFNGEVNKNLTSDVVDDYFIDIYEKSQKCIMKILNSLNDLNEKKVFDEASFMNNDFKQTKNTMRDHNPKFFKNDESNLEFENVLQNSSYFSKNFCDSGIQFSQNKNILEPKEHVFRPIPKFDGFQFNRMGFNNYHNFKPEIFHDESTNLVSNFGNLSEKNESESSDLACNADEILQMTFNDVENNTTHVPILSAFPNKSNLVNFQKKYDSSKLGYLFNPKKTMFESFNLQPKKEDSMRISYNEIKSIMEEKEVNMNFYSRLQDDLSENFNTIKIV